MPGKKLITAIDIGNSSINIGFFALKGLIVKKIQTHPLRSADEYSLILSDFLRKNHVEKHSFSVIIASVVSDYSPVFKTVFEKLEVKENGLDFLTVNHKLDTGLKFEIRNPEQLGADRIANAVGAFVMYKTPVAVIDFGTATTISAVDKDAQYIGGSIMPGLGMMNESLEKGTSRLKKIELEPPASALGKDTEGCIKSGIICGAAGAVERVLDEIEEERNRSFSVVLTGGYAELIDAFIKRPHERNANLTLEGLKILHDKNRPS